MISPRSWVWPVFSPITDSVFLPLRCQKKAEEADREGQRTLDQRVYLEGCGVLFSSTGMKRAVPCCLSCVFGSGCPPPLCLLCSPGDSVCAHMPMLLFPRNAGVCVTCLLPSPGLQSDLAVCAAVIVAVSGTGGPEGYHGDL